MISFQQRRPVYFVVREAELFEQFLHTHYVGQKRFSLEEGETLIPCLMHRAKIVRRLVLTRLLWGWLTVVVSMS